MLRRLVFGCLVAGLLLVSAAPAFAAPPTTETTTTKNLVETFVDVVPTCEGGGPLYTITTTSNLVMHETIFDDGRVHATFTQTGRFVAVPLEDPSLPRFTGRFTQWGGFNQNGSTVNGTFTFSLRGTGSDGSTVSINLVQHFNERPDGTVNELFHCH
jgi:hypothetical protein